MYDNSAGGKKRFVPKDAYVENLKKQTSMSPETLKELRQIGVTKQTQLRLEYFFYTNDKQKASKLSEELLQMGYSGVHRPSASDAKTFVITGWTTKMTMDESTVVSWTKQMCELGFKHDCDFDGWGTSPEQE
jgi:regulator of RNase E activity RraB